MSNKKIVKYLKGLSGVFNQLSKEVDKEGINEDSLNLMKKIGSDLLFKGVSLNIRKSFALDATCEKEKKNAR